MNKFLKGCKNALCKAVEFVDRNARKVVTAVVGLGATAVGSVAHAQTDIASTLTSVNGYWTTAEGIGIAILLFVIGRRVVKKL